MSIEVNGLSKNYGEQKAVDQLDFVVPQGQVVGFLGPNGAGKSTTMKMLTGYLKPSSGSAKICGIDVINSPLEVKRKIGYLPEHNPLYTDMYVKEFLSFIGQINKIPSLTSKVDEVINLTGLGLEQSKRIGQLSKGYRQRVGIAQALIHSPEVLIPG